MVSTLSSTKDSTTHYYFISLNFRSIEIEGERESSSKNKCTLGKRGGGEVAQKQTRANKGEGGGGQNLGILSKLTF